MIDDKAGHFRPTYSLWSFVVRHRVSLQDLAILLVIMVVMIYVAFEVDIFRSEGQVTPVEETVELDESLLLGGLLTLGLLIFSIRRFQAQKRETARRIVAEREARNLAYQDPLTGLANRRQFEEALAVAVGSMPPGGSLHAVLMLDLNGFKRVNDTYGHGAGDALLIVVGQRLSRAVRDGDLVARLGGDEFAVIARNLAGIDTVGAVAARIIGELAQPVIVDGIRHDIGAGIGIALMPSDGQTETEVLRKADLALYRAKAERRSAFRFFEEEMDNLVRERDQIEQALRLALHSDLIKPHYRPNFDLDTGKVIGFEAVMNFDLQDEAIEPSRAIAIAEEIGLVHEIGRRILATACEAAKQWGADIVLSFDLLPGQIKDKELAKSILEITASSGIDRERLEIGVSESAIVQDLETVRGVLQPLQQAGIRVALANFGTGYSNLYHLQALGLDKVKIDRRFIDDLGKEEARKIVKALAGLGRGLGMIVSADGALFPGSERDLKASGVAEFSSTATAVSADEAKYMTERGQRRSAL